MLILSITLSSKPLTSKRKRSVFDIMWESPVVLILFLLLYLDKPVDEFLEVFLCQSLIFTGNVADYCLKTTIKFPFFLILQLKISWSHCIAVDYFQSYIYISHGILRKGIVRNSAEYSRKSKCRHMVVVVYSKVNKPVACREIRRKNQKFCKNGTKTEKTRRFIRQLFPKKIFFLLNGIYCIFQFLK